MTHYRVQVDATGPAAPAVSSSTHPDQNAWYTNDTPSFSWSASDTSGITGYSYGLDQAANTAPDDSSEGTGTSWTSPTAKPDGTWYFHVKAKNGAGLWGTATHYRVQINASSPAPPVVSSSTHPNQAAWYSNSTPGLSWSASYPSGVAGYSYALDQLPLSEPDTVSEGVGNTVSYGYHEDGTWYFHIKAKNGVGSWSPTAHYQVNIDTGDPYPPSGLASSTHPPGVGVNNRSATVSWSPGSDLLSGVAGYSWVFNTSDTQAADATIDGNGSTLSATSAQLADGTYWFHVRTIDAAGNSSVDRVYGPIVVDGSAVVATLSPTLGSDLVAQSDEMGLEQFLPYRKVSLGTGQGFVELRTGNLVASFDDARVPNQGLNTVIRHVYNAQRSDSIQHDNGLGLGWTLSISDLDAGLDSVEGAVEDLDVGAQVVPIAAQVVSGAGTVAGMVLEFTDGDGTTHRFARRGGAGTRWDSPPGVSLRIREVTNGATPPVVVAYELVRPDGVVYRAENLNGRLGVTTNTWRVISIRDRKGNVLTYDYGLVAGKLRLTSISHNGLSSRGYSPTVATFTHDGAARLTDVTTLPGVAGAERRVHFDYDPNGRLWKATQAAHTDVAHGQRTTVYSYDASGRLAGVQDGRGATTTFAYVAGDPVARAAAITDRRGKNWTVTYGMASDGSGDAETRFASPVTNQTPGAEQAATLPGQRARVDEVIYQITSRTSVNGTADPRIAGGNIRRITDSGYGAGDVTTGYTWAQNRLVTVDGPRSDVDDTTTFRYNDLGMVLELTEPAPNSPRADLPSGATTARVAHQFAYRYPPLSQFRQVNCTDPAPDNATVSNEGYCALVADQSRITRAAGAAAQRVTDFVHDDTTGNLTSVTEPCQSGATGCTDRTTTFTYYGRGAAKTTDGPRSDVADVTTYGDGSEPFGGYGRSAQPTRVVDALSKVKTFTYSPHGLLLGVTDRDNRTTQYGYDERDNPIEQTDPAGHRTTWTYDANDNKTRETSPRGQSTPDPDDFTTIWTYDANDWLTQTSLPGANPADARRVAGIVYRENGTKLSETTPRAGSEVRYAYWPNQALKQVDAPGGSTTERALTDYTYDNAGHLSVVDGPVANSANRRPRTTTTYTPAGLVTTRVETSAVPNQDRSTRFAYNAHGELLRSDGPRTVGTVGTVEQATEHVYDSFGEVVTTRRRADSTRWIESQVGYDPAGNQVRVTQPTGQGANLESLYTYDALNRLSAQTKDPLSSWSHTVTYSYENEGAQTERVDKSGGAEKRRVSSRYNADGTLRSQIATDSFGDTFNLATCYYEGSDPASGYDADDNPLVVRSLSATADCSNGGTLSGVQRFTYATANDWLVGDTQTVRSPENGVDYSKTQSFTYDPDGTLASLTHDGRTVTYQHAPAGWLTALTDWRGRQSTWAYLPSGAPTTRQLNNANLTGTFDYTADGMPSQAIWTAGTAVVRANTNIGYDVGGLRTSETVAVRQPGTSSATSGEATFTYDALDRLSSWVAPFAESNGARRTGYSLDDAGNITREFTTTCSAIPCTGGATTADATSDYSSGKLHRMATSTPTGVPGVDDLTCIEPDYDEFAQEKAKFYYDHAAPGCLATGPSRYALSPHDPFGNIRSLFLSDPLGAVGGAQRVDYTHDGAQRSISRIETRTVEGVPVSTQATLYFFIGTTNALAEETDGTGQSMVRYLSDDQGQPIAQESYRAPDGTRNSTPTWTWLLPDIAGNVGTICDDTGAVLEQSAYDPYGTPKQGGAGKAANSPGSSLGFQTALTEKKTGTVLLGSRNYDPELRRFNTPDSYVAGGLDLALGVDSLTANRYLFAAANPVAFYDDGHAPHKKSQPKCQPYHAGRIRDYMTGALAAPCGFKEFRGYSPLIRTNRKAGERVAVYAMGYCSPGHGLPPGDVANAFKDACQSHDYAYDLLRFAASSGQFLLSDRIAADRQFNRMMGSVCGHTGYFGFFNKGRCQVWRGIAITVVSANTYVQGGLSTRQAP
ncbi:MAG: RHS repeat-associated core domain-containing protein [Gaiellales bacterium]